VDTPELTLDNGKLTTLDPKRPEAVRPPAPAPVRTPPLTQRASVGSTHSTADQSGHSSAVIQEVDMEDWDVDGLPAAEHRRLAASRSG
jgi:hypothetical protein